MLPLRGERGRPEVGVQVVEHARQPGPLDERSLERRGPLGGRVGILAGPGRRADRVLVLAGRPGRAARVDPVEQGPLVVVDGRYRQPGQRRAVVGVLQQVGDLGQQQAGGAVDRAAPAGEPLVGERAGGVGQQHALGPPFHDQAGEPGQVVGQVGAAQRGGGLPVEGRVVGDRVLQQQPPGPARGRFPLGRAFRADVVGLEQAGRAGQVLDRPGRAEQGGADVVVDVVERIAPVGIAGPVLRRPVGQPERPVIGQPVQHVHDGAFVLGDGRVEAEAVDRVGGRGERADQVGQADLDP